jgi:hypothetical protein
VHHLAELVDDDKEEVITRGSLRQRANEVKTHRVPATGRDRKGLEEVGRDAVTRLTLCTCNTPHDIVADICEHASPEDQLRQSTVGLISSQVPTQRSIVHLMQQSSADSITLRDIQLAGRRIYQTVLDSQTKMLGITKQRLIIDVITRRHYLDLIE